MAWLSGVGKILQSGIQEGKCSLPTRQLTLFKRNVSAQQVVYPRTKQGTSTILTIITTSIQGNKPFTDISPKVLLV